ncbi:MAG TPA: acetate--CoA ligase family protein [Stellaceae bacterium]|nr:acetate--CoA ligase family protein [Stellaceae bacterium]
MEKIAAALDRFFAPDGIAIIGASPETTKIRGQLLHLLRKNGYPGRLHPVNPSYAEIDGIPCFGSLAAIGAPVDVALIAIPAERVLPALDDCARHGVKYAVIISSGFAEQGGAQTRLQDEIAAFARRTGLRISGPNAEGFYSARSRVAATFSPALEPRPGEEPLVVGERRIGIVAQSGGMGFALYNRGRALGLSFSHIVSTGNEADLAAGDFFDHMARDDETAAILLFLEGVRDPATFIAAATAAAERGKPVIIAKIGRTTAGARAAQSHTASMAGWSAAYDAVFRRCGIIAATDPDEAVAIAAAFVTCPLPAGDRVAVVTASGGAGAWAADALAGAGLALPELSPALQQRIGEFIPAYGSARNPVDITAQAVRTGGLIRAVELLADSDEVDAVVVVLSLASETRISIDTAALKQIVARRAKPVQFYSYTLPSPLGRKVLAEAGLALHTSLAALASAMRALAQRGRYRLPPPMPPRPAEPALAAALAARRGALAEHAARQILAAAGLPLPPQRLVTRREELSAAADALGFPLALKIQSPDIAHKTEIGGVRLGIASVVALGDAYDTMIAAVRRARPAARLEGVLLQPMAKPGVEMIIGTIRDPVFGPLIMLGSGGVATELFKDVTYRLAPVDAAEARRMIDDLRAAPLLHGFRGGAPADIAALAALVAALSDFAATYRDTVQETEINPVIVHAAGEGCTIADALLTLATGEENPDTSEDRP